LATAYIGIGSNLGDRLGYIREAIAKLEQSQEIEIRGTSSVYETEPVGHKEQPCFLNAVLELNTALEPVNLLEHLLGIENQMGRKRDRARGPRNIDLDLLLYDDVVINSDELTLPHPRMHQRRFVLVPLAEIAPKVVHPSLKKTVEELLEQLSIDSSSRGNESEVRSHSETL
jgi:2-amino-4-hydroxy-6-hydroxymethyldihydropteridine diphosphokinase